MVAIKENNHAGEICPPVVLKRSLLLFLMILASVCAPSHNCQAATEQQLKIVYIYKFLSFVSLPGATSDSFTVVILGPDPFGPEIDVLGSKKVRGKSINIKRLAFLDESSCCQVLFVSPAMDKKLPHILEEAKKLQMLTISDMDDFVSQGGIIGFVVKDGRVRFEVNLKAARENNIKINSNLLEIASKVIR